MSKIKVFICVFVSLIFVLGFSSTDVNADVIPGTNYEIISDLALYDKTTNELYEFENEEVLGAFLDEKRSISSRSYVPSESRSVVEKVYSKIHTSGHQITTVFGGPHGGTMSLEYGVSVNAEDLTSSINHGVSYTVPKNKKGNIVVKTKIEYTQYRRESRMKLGYQNYTKWQYAGSYTVKKIVSNWYAPVYW